MQYGSHFVKASVFQSCQMNVLLTCNSGSVAIEAQGDPRFAPSQWETSLERNTVSHWLGANLESALKALPRKVILNSILMKCCSSPLYQFQMPNHFGILHRVWQLYWYALCKLWEWLSNWEISYGLARFEFRMSFEWIFYFSTTPWSPMESTVTF